MPSTSTPQSIGQRVLRQAQAGSYPLRELVTRLVPANGKTHPMFRQISASLTLTPQQFEFVTRRVQA